MKTESLILKNWWATRYVPESIEILSFFDDLEGDDREKSNFFLSSILQTLSNPQLVSADPRFPEYGLPKVILEDNVTLRKKVVERVSILQEQTTPVWADTKKFLIDNHENIKRAQNRWFAANPGLLLEWVKISGAYQKVLVDWLQKQGISLGDDTIHLHVISNNGRRKIREMGFDVPYDHWDESYYRDMLAKCVEIMEANPNVKGLFCDSSWVHNPYNFNIAPDGVPFVSFNFLKDEKLVGKTLDITDSMSQKNYETQLNFATRSPRRKKYVDEGAYDVRVVASFYSRDQLIANKEDFT